MEDRTVLSIFTVANTNDSGAGSLRQAITDANSHANSGGPDLINFNIPGTTVHTISPASGLPQITEAVTIDGYSRPGAVRNNLPAGDSANILIDLDGGAPGNGGLGLVFLNHSGSGRPVHLGHRHQPGHQRHLEFAQNVQVTLPSSPPPAPSLPSPAPLSAPLPPPVLLAVVVKQKRKTLVLVLDAATGALLGVLGPFPGRVQVQLKDVNGDGVNDVVVLNKIPGKKWKPWRPSSTPSRASE
jgi:hypothetical protein